jgi:hypothetical protein
MLILLLGIKEKKSQVNGTLYPTYRHRAKGKRRTEGKRTCKVLQCTNEQVADATELCCDHSLIEIGRIVSSVPYAEETEIRALWYHCFPHLPSDYEPDLVDITRICERGCRDPGDASVDHVIDLFVRAAR